MLGAHLGLLLYGEVSVMTTLPDATSYDKIKFMSFDRSELGIHSLSLATGTSKFVYSTV